MSKKSSSDDPKFNPAAFIALLKKFARKLSHNLLEKVLVGYQMTIDPLVPNSAKAILIPALVYVGIPIDAIPDVIPGLGLTDDTATLIGAMALVAVNFRPRHAHAARETMRAWGFKLGSEDDRTPEEGGAAGFLA